MTPLVSICIPTHHGRARTLDETLASVRREGAGLESLLEVCISDNASGDETSEIVARHAAESALPIHYQRNPHNLGFGRNLLKAVAMARGRWCWLLSSDDALLPGAAGHVLWLAERYADAPGISVCAAWFDRDLREEMPVLPDAAPIGRETTDTLFEGRPSALRAVGNWWAYMSAQLVRADAWRSAVAALPPAALAGAMFPHSLVFARIVRNRPAWGWSPAAIVAGRGDNAAHGHLEAVDHGLLLARVAREWRRLVAAEVPEARLRAELADDWLRIYTSGQTLSDRLALGMSRRGRLRLAAELAGWAWRSPALWRETLPGLIRGKAAADRPPGRPPSAPLDHGSLLGSVAIDPPLSWFPRAGARLSCRLENRGERPFPHTPPHPVAVGARWIDAESGETVDWSPRARLRGPLGPGEATELELELRAPARQGDYLLRIAPLQEQVAWFDDLDVARGWSQRVAVELPVREAVLGLSR